MTQSERIILNTCVTYGRTILNVILTLFSSRWVLQALGESDFGLFNVVGTIILFIMSFNIVLTSSVARHYAFAIGEVSLLSNESTRLHELRQWVNSAVSIHTVLPLLLVIIGYPIGVYCIKHVLVIPSDRIVACLWVFRISLVTMVVSTLSVPFVAIYTARQLIAELTFFSVLYSLLTFISAYCLLYVPFDKLIVYAFFLMGIRALIPCIQVLRAYALFPECQVKISYLFNREKIVTLIRYAGWQSLGMFGQTIRNQGLAIFVNLAYGPRVNAAYGIANQVAIQTGTLSNAFDGALTPALTSMQGRGDHATVVAWIYRACKMCAYLMLFVMIPFLLETDFVLAVWLKKVPDYTAVLCGFIMFSLFVDKMTVGCMTAIYAKGQIALYQILIGSCLTLTIPTAIVFYYLGWGVASLGAGVLIWAIIGGGIRLFITKQQHGISYVKWAKTVFLPVVGTGLLIYSAGLLIRMNFQPSYFRLSGIVMTSLFLLAICGFCFIFDKSERHMFFSKIDKIRGYLRHAKTCK